MISFIMMAKNVQNYIEETIIELQKENAIEWELIIVEDNSEDKTFEIIKNISDKDNRITLVKNKYRGKVLGTNYGYQLTKGNIIKCIDSDDILLKDFFKEYENLLKYDVHCHSVYIVDEKLNKICTYNVNTKFITDSYEDVVKKLISLPKCTWSFKREIADKIFPIPETLPFEDVWISIIIKKNAKSFYNIKKPLYLYRQHSNQTYGGILNFKKKIVIYRANRMLLLIDVLKNENIRIHSDVDNILVNIKNYYSLLKQDKISMSEIIFSSLEIKLKMRLILFRKLSFIAKAITIFKWKI